MRSISLQNIPPQKAAAQLVKLFCAHPGEAGETYLQHLAFTLRTAGELLTIAVLLALHGLFPFICTATASDRITKVYEILTVRANKQQPGA